jgi:hypothetical protein
MLVPPAKQERDKVFQVRFNGFILQPTVAKLGLRAELALARAAASLPVGATLPVGVVMSAVGVTSAAAGWLLWPAAVLDAVYPAGAAYWSAAA